MSSVESRQPSLFEQAHNFMQTRRGKAAGLAGVAATLLSGCGISESAFERTPEDGETCSVIALGDRIPVHVADKYTDGDKAILSMGWDISELTRLDGPDGSFGVCVEDSEYARVMPASAVIESTADIDIVKPHEFPETHTGPRTPEEE